MDRPLVMGLAVARELRAVEIEEHEIVRSHSLAERDRLAFKPDAAVLRVAERHVAELLVAVAFHLEDAMGKRELLELGPCRVAHCRR